MRMIAKLAFAASLSVLAAASAQAQTTPSTVDGAAQQKGAQPQPPKTTGAMENATTGVATSPEDVKRQTEGKPTAADEAKGATATAPKPGVTQHSPGTVGAAPGAPTPSSGAKTQ